MHKSATAFNQEISEEVSEDVALSIEEKQDKVLRLYENIQLLRELISSKILKELKTCKKSCEDANDTLIGALNGNAKK